jgi:hypothetical protein
VSAALTGSGNAIMSHEPVVSQMEDFTSPRAFRVAGPTAFTEAGITHNDVDHLMIYDAPCSQPGDHVERAALASQPIVWRLL